MTQKIVIKIKEQEFLNNGDLILPSIKDSSGNLLKNGIENWLNSSYDLICQTRKKGKTTITGYKAGSLNEELRKKINCISGVHGETHVKYGAILKTGKKGFDFSLFDEEYNIVKLRNSFIGNPGVFNGEQSLLTLNQKVLKSDNKTFKRSEWKNKVDLLGGTPGENIMISKKQYTVVGEIQCGNWALAEHDLLRLLNSSIDGEIDYYVYITPTGELAKSLSSGIVSFPLVVNLLKENKQLIKTPVWIIGIDIDNDN